MTFGAFFAPMTSATTEAPLRSALVLNELLFGVLEGAVRRSPVAVEVSIARESEFLWLTVSRSCSAKGRTRPTADLLDPAEVHHLCRQLGATFIQEDGNDLRIDLQIYSPQIKGRETGSAGRTGG